MTVAPDEFVREMEVVWTLKFGSYTSPRFRELWRTMAETYLEAIRTNMAFNPLQIGKPDWLVLAPEMGSGKTAGACLYLGLMARMARDAKDKLKIGGLLVCRTIQQCDDAVADVNEYAGFPCAIAKHSSNETTLALTRGFPVLVITHEALINASKIKSQSIDALIKMDGGRRCLVIIDEALSNAVEFHRVTLQSLSGLLGHITAGVQAKNVVAVDFIERLLDRLRTVGQERTDAHIIWNHNKPGQSLLDELPGLFAKLLADIRESKVQSPDHNWNDPEQRKGELKVIQEMLRSVNMIFRHWAMFVTQGTEQQMKTAKATIPRLVCPVVLNATAAQDTLIDHIRARIIPTPRVREYRNLTLKVLHTNGTGKTVMKERAGTRLQKLAAFVKANTEPTDLWMVVTHKGTEAIAAKYLPTESTKIAHWGALDGLNSFKECNKAILFGISYRDPNWSSEMYFALRGAKGEDWFNSQEAIEAKHQIESKLIASQVLQAIGRPRSRRVCDEAGNCLPTTIYLTLPENKLGLAVEHHIRSELSGVVIEEWEYQLDENDKVGGPVPESDMSASVLTYMRNSPPGRFTVNGISDALGFSSKQKANFKGALKRRRNLVTHLDQIGVIYLVEGERKGAKSYLVKAASSYGGKPLKDL